MATEIPDGASLIEKADSEPSMRPFQQQKLEKEAQRNWDLFYKRNTVNFFKDRHWIHREFPELAATGEVASMGTAIS